MLKLKMRDIPKWSSVPPSYFQKITKIKVFCCKDDLENPMVALIRQPYNNLLYCHLFFLSI